MNLLHELNGNQNDSQSIEGLYEARNKTIQLLNEIKNNLYEGINEVEARKLAIKIASDLGTNKHWHQPYIRIGSGTALSFHEPLQEQNILFPNLPYYIDLGPVWKMPDHLLEYEGDYGDTFIFGENAEAEICISLARQLFIEAKNKWTNENYTGEQIYQFIRKKSQEAGYVLMEDFDGHRISDFPHHNYTLERLANIPFTPSPSLWILELQINDPEKRFGAFYEDTL